MSKYAVIGITEFNRPESAGIVLLGLYETAAEAQAAADAHVAPEYDAKRGCCYLTHNQTTPQRAEVREVLAATQRDADRRLLTGDWGILPDDLCRALAAERDEDNPPSDWDVLSQAGYTIVDDDDYRNEYLIKRTASME